MAGSSPSTKTTGTLFQYSCTFKILTQHATKDGIRDLQGKDNATRKNWNVQVKAQEKPTSHIETIQFVTELLNFPNVY